MSLRSRRLRLKDMKKKCRSIQNGLMLFPVYVILGALIIAVSCPSTETFTGSALVISVHVCLFFGSWYGNMRALEFSQRATCFLLAVHILFLLFMPLIMTTDLSSGFYKKSMKMTIQQREEACNCTFGDPESMGIFERIFIKADRETGEFILPILKELRTEDPQLYHYWLGLIMGFLCQMALLYHTALIAAEYVMIKMLRRYVWIIYIENNMEIIVQPLVQENHQ